MGNLMLTRVGLNPSRFGSSADDTPTWLAAGIHALSDCVALPDGR